MDLKYKGKVEDLVKMPNIFDKMEESDQKSVGLDCLNGLTLDKSSREQWELRQKNSMELALQVTSKKTYPWPGASNVKFPLVTIAATNWHAKAYPATISGESVARCRVIGADPDGKKMARAIRVGKDMSYELLETTSWEEQTDKSLLVLPIMGTVFKKTIRDTVSRSNVSDMVLPQDLVVNYYTASMESAMRVTHLFKMTKNEMHEAVQAGIFCEPGEITQDSTTPMVTAKEKAQGITPNWEKDVYSLAEMSCWLDLDDDGYAEPYAVTFDENSGHPYRLVARYFPSDIKRVESGKKKGEILRITPENYYTKYEFIPSPDGGFYGLGLGTLVGPLNESVNTAINQIFDGGTMATLGGGFLGRGVKIKSGDSTFKPNEWKNVDSTGVSLKDNIVPLPVREPSMILLELLKFLVQYGQQVSGAGDIEMGDIPGQNVKAGTMSIANQNGQKIFKATYKRFWRSLKEELKKLYRLKQLYPSGYGNPFDIQADDYAGDASGIIPSADPNIVSDDERRQLAMMIAQRAAQTPGYDQMAVEMRLLDAFNVEGVESLYKGPPPNPPPNPEMIKLQLEGKKLDIMLQGQQQNGQLAQARLMVDAQKIQAEIEELRAKAMMEQQKANNADVGQIIAMLDLEIAAKKNHHESILSTIDMIHTLMGGKNGDGLGIKREHADALATTAASTLPQLAAPTGNGGVFPATNDSAGGSQGMLG